MSRSGTQLELVLGFVEELFITALNFLIAIDNGRVILVGTDPR